MSSAKSSNLFELILRADIYGSRPQLKIAKLESFNTGFGSFLTALTLFGILAVLTLFSMQLFDVENPKIVFSVRNIFNPPLFELSEKNYGFAFGLQDPITYDQFIDESIYRVEVYQKRAVRVPVVDADGNKTESTEFQWTSDKLEVERCTISKFPTSFTEIFQNMPLSEMYCLKNTSFSLFGTFLNDEYSFLYLQLFECRNETNPNKDKPCKPKEYIDEILAGTFFLFSHTDITIDPTNYTDPNQNYAGDSYTTISSKYFKEIHHYVKQVNIETDRGWLTKDVKESNFLKNDFVKEMIDFRSFDNFLAYTLKLSTVVEKYTRTYQKVQNVAAEVGGIIKLMSIICIVLSFFYNKARFYELLTNELFDSYTHTYTKQKEFKDFMGSKNMTAKMDFKMLGNLDLSNSKNKFNIDNSSAIINNFTRKEEKNCDKSFGQPPVNPENRYDNLIPNNKENQINRIKNRKDNITLSFCQSFFYFVFPCCFKKTRGLKILDRACHKIDERLDILNILRHLQDLKRLKAILLDEDQLKLFNLPYRSKIHTEGKSIKRRSTLGTLKFIEAELPIKEITEAYERVKQKNHDNRFSEKLINVLSMDYKLLLE